MPEIRGRYWLLALLVAVSTAAALAQTVITEPKNRYTPAQDVQLGREAAAQVEKEMRILRDEQAASFVTRIGRRLVEAAPSDLKHPEFQYSFKVVDAPEINAFALPGGPTYFNRGMIVAAQNEGEVAGVLAHELSHVLLRHGTAQATRATPYQIGQVAGSILGAIVGGQKGQIIAQGSQFGIGAAFLRFSREYERQSDLLGAQIMARAGYDPRDEANMFRTIEKLGNRSGAPEFLSSHPNPGNRYEYVMREAQTLRVENATRDTDEFRTVRQRLGSGAAAAATGGTPARPSSGRSPGVDPRDNVEYPSTEYRAYSADGAFQVQVPANWRELPGTNGVTFAPEGAYGQGGFTHGVEIALGQTQARALPDATRELIAALRQNNQGLREQPARSTTIDGRPALETVLSNQAATGAEAVRIVTTMPSAGTLLYVIAVVPAYEEAQYRTAFSQILRSLRLAR